MVFDVCCRSAFYNSIYTFSKRLCMYTQLSSDSCECTDQVLTLNTLNGWLQLEVDVSWTKWFDFDSNSTWCGVKKNVWLLISRRRATLAKIQNRDRFFITPHPGLYITIHHHLLLSGVLFGVCVCVRVCVWIDSFMLIVCLFLPFEWLCHGSDDGNSTNNNMHERMWYCVHN